MLMCSQTVEIKPPPPPRKVRFAILHFSGQTTITSAGGYTHRFGVDGTILNMDVTTDTTYDITPSAQMIAMRCDGQGGARGRCLAGSADGWTKTNVTWKCLDYAQSNWWTLSCDPSSWPNAVELGSNNGSFAPQVAGISADAMWITSKVVSTAVFCRVFLGRLVSIIKHQYTYPNHLQS